MADPAVVTALRKVAIPFALNSLAQAAALAALGARAELAPAVAAGRRRTHPGARGAARLGYEVPVSRANFVWLPLRGASAEFAAHSEQHKVIVRAFAGHLRWSRGVHRRPHGADAFLAAAAAFPADPHRRGLAQLAAALDRAARTPRVGRARQAMAFADGRSASANRGAGWPSPGPAYRRPTCRSSCIRPPAAGSGPFGLRVARATTVGEFDGRIKYGRLVPSGRQPGDVVFQEKRREDLIRGEGITVVRWTWAELDDGTAADRIRRALHLV